ncbi:uncharacterized protein FMAN_03484 [Fusarium mangiferae]|uniref:C2H2-type domain-containing protein n=1 Tax=Fusarium mangiferae TaxID=192010 RepID=A0A1L7TDY4_FUSMA|nr:uncharacterized protein FMAN_03484 [Fusarium mangiferae]CVK94343.1 uncharacterized protein FMAN_03484 [Fusarium mangiferae]
MCDQQIREWLYVAGGVLKVRYISPVPAPESSIRIPGSSPQKQFSNLLHQEHTQDFFAGIEVDEIWLNPRLFSDPGLFVSPRREPHADSPPPCCAFSQTKDLHGLGGISSLHYIHSNILQESYRDSDLPYNEPLEVVGPRNPDSAFLSKLNPFFPHQRSRNAAVYETPPHRQHLELSPCLPPSYSISPHPAWPDDSPLSIFFSSSSPSSSPCILSAESSKLQGMAQVCEDTNILHSNSHHKPTIDPERGSFRCIKCSINPFKYERDLKRHLDSKHSGAFYVCRCGYSNGRKDVYRNHLLKENCSGERSYICTCGRSTCDLAEHRHHFEGCRKGKRGRPTKQNARVKV